MKILKLLNKKILSITLVSLIFFTPVFTEEKPIDIWNIEKKDNQVILETNISSENSSGTTQNSVYELQTNKQTDKYMNLTVNDKVVTPSTQVIRDKYSNFKGMKCAVGFTRLHIKPNGDVYPSACLLNYRGARMGNIYKKNIIKPKSYLTCPFNECLCGPDIRVEKWAQ